MIDKKVKSEIKGKVNRARREWYQKGYQDGLNASKWIPCSERLPEGCDDAEIVVLATVKADESEMSLDTDDRVVPALYYPLTKHFYTGWNRLKITRDVIAWMYLPEPYKGESHKPVLSQEVEDSIMRHFTEVE